MRGGPAAPPSKKRGWGSEWGVPSPGSTPQPRQGQVLAEVLVTGRGRQLRHDGLLLAQIPRGQERAGHRGRALPLKGGVRQPPESAKPLTPHSFPGGHPESQTCHRPCPQSHPGSAGGSHVRMTVRPLELSGGKDQLHKTVVL